jgi:hypothetical protein
VYEACSLDPLVHAASSYYTCGGAEAEEEETRGGGVAPRLLLAASASGDAADATDAACHDWRSSLALTHAAAAADASPAAVQQRLGQCPQAHT